MQTIQTVLRSISGETKISGEKKNRRDHLNIFREFLDHLDRTMRRHPPARTTMKSAKAKTKRGQR